MFKATSMVNKASNGQSWLVQAADRLYLWQQRAKARRQLMQLDDRQLKDVGLSRALVEIEAAKPFWQA